MEERLIELTQLSDAEIKSLAALHQSVMHTLLSDLGLPMVLRYYHIVQADPDVIGFCLYSATGAISGWAIGSPHPDRINTQLRSPLPWFLLQISRIAMTRPSVLLQLLSSVLSTSNRVGLTHGAIELTYIGVAPDQRGRGTGKRVLNAFIEASRSKGYRSVVLSVEKENLSAISLYEKAGFQLVKTIWEGRYQRHRMELMLA